MTKPLKSSTHLWSVPPPTAFHDTYSALDSSGRLSAGSSPSRSPMTPATPLRSLGAAVGEPGGGFGSPSSKGAQFTIIANVPYDTVRQDLVTEFRKFGRVELAMVVCDEASRHPHKEWTSTAGYAFVRFSKRGEAAAAIQAATMGLITIRGTRVRADWARKDSYAKRGRVSAAQGAPSLGPYGIPDGIAMLHDTLTANRQQGLDWDGSCVGSGGEVSVAIKLPDLGTIGQGVVVGGECNSSISALLKGTEGLVVEEGSCCSCSSSCSCSSTTSAAAVFESLAQALNLRAQSQPEMVGICNGSFGSVRGCELIDVPRIEEGSFGLVEEDDEEEREAALIMGSPLSAMIAAEAKLCTQLVDMLSEHESSRGAPLNESMSSSSDTSSLLYPHSGGGPSLSSTSGGAEGERAAAASVAPPPAAAASSLSLTTTAKNSLVHYMDYYPGAPSQIADLLSPTSRGLLSSALSDVVSPNAFPPDVSPICKATARHEQGAIDHYRNSTATSSKTCSPEDLLKLAVSKLPINVSPATSCSGLGDESAQTKTGSSSHRSTTSVETDSAQSTSSDGEEPFLQSYAC